MCAKTWLVIDPSQRLITNTAPENWKSPSSTVLPRLQTRSL